MSRKNSQKWLSVFIGRFSPYGDNHRTVLEHAAKFSDSILMLVGSSYRPRSFKNPFTYNERKAFIEAGTRDLGVEVNTLPLIDTLYDDEAWKTNVLTAVKMHMRAKGFDEQNTRVILVGYDKDKSSRYLNWFPGWHAEPTKAPHLHNGKPVSATDLRRAVFLGEDVGDIVTQFGAGPVANVSKWASDNPQAVDLVRTEGEYNRAYQARIAVGEAAFGFPIQINCVDNVVIQNGHILLVERDTAPGLGLMALPGGHLGREIHDQSGKVVGFEPETALDAAIRELYEETRLDVPRGTLRSAMRTSRVFDHPDRAERGWVRTEAFLFQLQNSRKFENIKASSDARDARWVPLTDITPTNMFEDHFDIVQSMAPGAVPFTYSSLLLAHAA
jgi:bifunctional NMN adenylyltransferase/nudix hydrolase